MKLQLQHFSHMLSTVDHIPSSLKTTHNHQQSYNLLLLCSQSSDICCESADIWRKRPNHREMKMCWSLMTPNQHIIWEMEPFEPNSTLHCEHCYSTSLWGWHWQWNEHLFELLFFFYTKDPLKRLSSVLAPKAWYYIFYAYIKEKTQLII